MPPWKLRGARLRNVIWASARPVTSFNGRARLPSQVKVRPTTGPICHTSQKALHAAQTTEVTPLRKQLKDEAKAKRDAGADSASKASTASHEKLLNWELTVGIEIHAQLNTARKLFSRKCSCKRRMFEAYLRQTRPLLSMKNQTLMSHSSILPLPVPYPYSRKQP